MTSQSAEIAACSECGHMRREHIFDDRCIGRIGRTGDPCPCRRQPTAITADAYHYRPGEETRS